MIFSMSLEVTKSHFVQLLSDSDSKVIALSGKWGTGKSHLWREVKENSPSESVRSALYVSLFGLTDINQVKLKLVQSAIPAADAHPGLWSGVKHVIRSASKGLEGFHKSFSALNDLALLVVPVILRNRIIVLDDIERKHEKLSVDEVMGFVDEFTQQYGARIVLILNSDQLADRGMWERLREKVIDQEVKLETSAEEAFDIALGIVGTSYAGRIKETTCICEITNIRVISRIIRAVNRILGGREDLSSDVLDRLIPSTVLLSAIHFKALDDGPDLNFVMQVGNPDQWDDWGKKEEELDELGKQRSRWRRLLQELRIHGCDEYEQLIVKFLNSGLFDLADVTKIVTRYASEAEMVKAQILTQQMHDHVLWHHQLSEEELLAEAESLALHVHLLDQYNVTSLATLVSSISGGDAVAELMIGNWISALKGKNSESIDFDDSWGRPIHPRIQDELIIAKAALHVELSIFDAAMGVSRNGWGMKEEVALKSASVEDFEIAIKSLSPENLRRFMLRLVGMCAQADMYRKHFESATDNFTKACRKIYAENTEARLAKLIELLFRDAKIEASLGLSSDA